MLEELQRQIDDLHQEIDEEIHNEFVQLQNDTNLEEEFKNNVSEELEEKNSSESLKKKKNTLFTDKNYVSLLILNNGLKMWV